MLKGIILNMYGNNFTIESFDSELWEAFEGEKKRQEEHIELIASENYASPRILEAQGSILTNKYACLLYTSPSPRDRPLSRMPSSA